MPERPAPRSAERSRAERTRGRRSRGEHSRGERGALFPSPVVILSIVAVAMAAVAFVATRGGEPTEREVTTAAADPTPGTPRLPKTEPRRIERKKPVVERGQVYVEVYNNSGITGLAAKVSARASEAGWQVVGTDNWYGTIPANTVYYPPRLQPAAKQLALDLGIRRSARAVDPMRLDRLTLILTDPLG